MQTEGLGYRYAFDDDFDAVEDVYRLETATNPHDPKLTQTDGTVGGEVQSQDSRTS